MPGMLRAARSQKPVPPALRRCWKKTKPFPDRNCAAISIRRRSGCARRDSGAGQVNSSMLLIPTPRGSSSSSRFKRAAGSESAC